MSFSGGPPIYGGGGQPVYSYPIQHAGGYVLSGHRVGLSDNLLGQWPTLNGIYRALARTEGPRVLVKVWGEPNPGAWGNAWGNSPTMHEGTGGAGKWASFIANKNDLMRWLLWPGRAGYTRNPGGGASRPGFLSSGGEGDSGAALFVAENGALDFLTVYRVAFEPLPITSEGAGHHNPARLY